MRFALTSEAGLNNGLAFPFTNAAIAMAVAGTAPRGWLVEWLAVAVVLKIGVGILVGRVVGKALAYLIFEVSTGDTHLTTLFEGTPALGTTLASYALAEVPHKHVTGKGCGIHGLAV